MVVVGGKLDSSMQMTGEKLTFNIIVNVLRDLQ